MGKKGLNIYHRKDGRWEGRYKDGFKADGKPKYRSVYAKSYGEVKEVLIHIQNTEMKPKSTCPLTVQQIFTEWIQFISVSFHLKLTTSPTLAVAIA